MNNLEKEKKKLDTPDIIIISGIIISIVIAIFGTIFWVRYKYNKEHKKELSTYTTIPNNKTYRYKLTDNKIDFYDGKEIVDTYTCIRNCSIDKEKKDQFILEYDSFIPINDNNKYVIYNIDIKATYYTFDTYPEKTNNEKIGIITKDKKKGLINKKGGLVQNTEFDDIEVTENYIITIKNGTANIYNKFNSKLTNNEINNIEEILPLEKDDKLYLYLTNKNNEKSVLEYDAKTNKLS